MEPRNQLLLSGHWLHSVKYHWWRRDCDLTPNSLEEDLAGSTEMVRTVAWVGVHALAQVRQILHYNQNTMVIRAVMEIVHTSIYTKTNLGGISAMLLHHYVSYNVGK